MRIARVIHYPRQYTQSTSPRFLLVSLITFVVLLIALVLAVADLSYGQDEPKTGPLTQAAPGANDPKPVSVPATVKPKPPATSTPAAPVDPCMVCKGPYCPTVLQCKDLQIVQGNAIIASQALDAKMKQEELRWPEFSQQQQAVQALIDECHKVMVENKWPTGDDGVRCNPNSRPITFVIPEKNPAPAAATPAPAPAPAVKKPTEE